MDHDQQRRQRRKRALHSEKSLTVAARHFLLQVAAERFRRQAALRTRHNGDEPLTERRRRQHRSIRLVIISPLGICSVMMAIEVCCEAKQRFNLFYSNSNKSFKKFHESRFYGTTASWLL
jgi:hypothetical protein